MTKDSLQAKLDELKQQSESTINQITQYENAIVSLKEQALVIKGKYQAIEELLPDISVTKKGKPDAKN